MGPFIGLGVTFQSLWQQLICPISYILSKGVKKSLILLVKSFLGNFYRYLAFFVLVLLLTFNLTLGKFFYYQQLLVKTFPHCCCFFFFIIFETFSSNISLRRPKKQEKAMNRSHGPASAKENIIRIYYS